MATTGRAASYGVLFKDAEAMQKACKVNCVLLDKTATITVGKPKVTDYVNLGVESDSKIKSMVSALEDKSSHPLAKSIIEFCGEGYHTVSEYEYVTGRGIIGEIGGTKYYLGNLELLPQRVKVDIDKEKYQGKTLIYFADDFSLLAVLALPITLKKIALKQ
jgi:cation transport ATPase